MKLPPINAFEVAAQELAYQFPLTYNVTWNDVFQSVMKTINVKGMRDEFLIELILIVKSQK